MAGYSDNRLWPFRPKASLVAAILIFIVLLVMAAISRNLGYMEGVSDNSLLIGILIFSLLPILLLLVDNFMDRGGSIEYKGVKINFAQVPQLTTVGFTVPINIGVPSQSVSDSDTTRIIDALQKATSCNVVIIDLEGGKAWWETRLLVLLAGAARRGRPDKVVFVATEYTTPNSFLGWAHSTDLLKLLLTAHPQYLRSYHAAMAAGKQWELVEPFNPLDPPIIPPPVPPIIQPGLALSHPGLAFTNGLPNEFFPEQLLAADLGNQVERQPGGPRHITVTRLEELFRSILERQHIDLAWSTERQYETYFESDADFLAVTKNRSYQTMVSKLAILNTIVKEMAGNTKK